MPNLTAYIVLFCWPLVALLLFRTMRPEHAVIWTVLGGYLFLPVRPVIDFPLLPAIDKDTISGLCAVIGALLVRRGWGGEAVGPADGRAMAGMRAGRAVHSRFAGSGGGGDGAESAQNARDMRGARGATGMQAERRLLPLPMICGLVLLAVIGVVGSVMTNADPIPAGPFLLPAMRSYDLASLTLGLAVMLIPFLIGWRFLGHATGQRAILMAFALGGLLYAPLMLLEVRLSPQLNVWLYGFFPHSFAQHVRNGGFRPIVFLDHGLWVGIFMAMAVLAALAQWRLTPTGTRPFDRLRWLLLAGFLLVVLVLAKSLGALVIALAMGCIVLVGGRRIVMLAAAGVAVLVLVYPMARGLGIVPVEAVLDLAGQVSAERAASLGFRLQNEDVLLASANERALFGWGGFGRGLIFDAWGNLISVSDGVWIIMMVSSGWVGYLAKFGLLCLAVVAMLWRRTSPEAVFLSAVLAANLLDMIPNATLEPITWLVAGAVAGTRVVPDGAGVRDRRRADVREGAQVSPAMRRVP